MSTNLLRECGWVGSRFAVDEYGAAKREAREHEEAMRRHLGDERSCQRGSP